MTKRKWNWASHVTTCSTCEGHGTIHALRRATINDPYPEDACPDCEGEHEPACEACGYNMPVDGYDCFACDMVASIYENQLASLDIDTLAAAMKVARNLALADYEASLATASESTVPMVTP